MHQGMPLPSVACRAWRPGADPVNEGGCTSALLVEVGDGVGSSELASACSVSGCFGSPYLWVAGSWLSQNSEFARLAGGGRGLRTSGPTSERTTVRRAPLFVFSGQAAPAAIVILSPRMTTSSSRHPKVISLVERREETWDGKAERKDGTDHRFDRRRRPACCAQARASRRARAGAWP